MTSIWVEIGGADVSADVRTCQPLAAGPGVRGRCKLVLRQAGGGLVVDPLARVKVARKSGSNFDKRLFQGVVGVRRTWQVLGTNMKFWEIDCADLALLLERIVTPVAWSYSLAAAHYHTQIAAVVAAVQASGGGSPEGIDATSQVPDLSGANLPAQTLEGGHMLAWYLDQVDTQMRIFNAAVSPARYVGCDATAGPSTFGGALLYVYDANLLPTASATHTDTNSTIRRQWERLLDAVSYYGRRQATYPGGVVLAVAGSPLPNPWFAPGWVAEPLQVNTSDAGVAQATADYDVAAAGVRETVRYPVGSLVQAGDVVALTLALEGLAAAKYRVVESPTDWLGRNTDQPEAEVTLGVVPRRMGQGPMVPGRPLLRDTVPPVPPLTQPTVVSNLYDPYSNKTVCVLSSVNSTSADVADARLRYTENGGAPHVGVWTPCGGPAPATTTFPEIRVAPGATVVADVDVRDTAGNVQPTYGPARTFTAALGGSLMGTPTSIWDLSAASAPVVLTLPLAATFGVGTLVVLKTDGSANTVTLNRAGADTINGGSTPVVLSTQYQSGVLRSDGVSAWYQDVASGGDLPTVAAHYVLAGPTSGSPAPAAGRALVAGDIPTLAYGGLSGLPTLGTAAAKDIPAAGDASSSQVVYGSDTRLTNTRTPTAHKSSHAAGGGDALSPADIAAAALSLLTTAGDTIYASGASTWARLARGVAGQIKGLNATPLPAWGNLPYGTRKSGGYYYGPDLFGAVGVHTFVDGTAIAVPFYSGNGGTADRIGIGITTGNASSVIRLGLYNSDPSTGYPTTVLLDAGTVDSSAGAGAADREITISQVLAPNTLYWLVAVAQGGTPATRGYTASGSPLVLMTAVSNNLGAGYKQTSVSGALGTWTSTPGLSNTAPRPYLRF